MDWSNERFVRLYTRDTPEWLCWSWQARALWPHLIRKADRSGVIANKLGARGLAALVSLPLDLVEAGLPDLFADGCLKEHQLGYVIPNYIEAQETPQSDAQRQRESRERRRVVTKRDSESQNVTECHAPSREVTACHSDPIRSDPDPERDPQSLLAPVAEYPTRNGIGPGGEQPLLLLDLGRVAKPQAPVQEQPAPAPKPQRSAPRRALDPAWSPSRTEAILEAERAASARGVDVALELAQLRDWAAANGERKADWDATWSGWLRRARPTTNGGFRPLQPERKNPMRPM